MTFTDLDRIFAANINVSAVALDGRDLLVVRDVLGCNTGPSRYTQAEIRIERIPLAQLSTDGRLPEPEVFPLYAWAFNGQGSRGPRSIYARQKKAAMEQMERLCEARGSTLVSR